MVVVGFGENLPVLSLVLFFFCEKRELEGRQEDFEIQHHLTNEIYLLRPSSKHSLCQNEWGVFCLT